MNATHEQHVALTLLGSLAVCTFWGNPSGLPKRRRTRRL